MTARVQALDGAYTDISFLDDTRSDIVSIFEIPDLVVLAVNNGSPWWAPNVTISTPGGLIIRRTLWCIVCGYTSSPDVSMRRSRSVRPYTCCRCIVVVVVKSPVFDSAQTAPSITDTDMMFGFASWPDGRVVYLGVCANGWTDGKIPRLELRESGDGTAWVGWAAVGAGLGAEFVNSAGWGLLPTKQASEHHGRGEESCMESPPSLGVVATKGERPLFFSFFLLLLLPLTPSQLHPLSRFARETVGTHRHRSPALRRCFGCPLPYALPLAGLAVNWLAGQLARYLANTYTPLLATIIATLSSLLAGLATRETEEEKL
jgi:hypothetical protein